MSHTPGPWARSRDAVPDWHVQLTVYEESTGNRIATVFEREANADLFVAAPDLLAACQDALDLLRFMHDQIGPHNCTIGCPDIHKRERRLAAAIAKAKHGA